METFNQQCLRISGKSYWKNWIFKDDLKITVVIERLQQLMKLSADTWKPGFVGRALSFSGLFPSASCPPGWSTLLQREASPFDGYIIFHSLYGVGKSRCPGVRRQNAEFILHYYLFINVLSSVWAPGHLRWPTLCLDRIFLIRSSLSRHLSGSCVLAIAT